MTHSFKKAALSGVVLSAVFGLSACVTHYPLDIPESQWEVMSEEDRQAAREQQASIDEALAEQRAAEANAREEEARLARLALEVRRQEAPWGERIQCVLEGEARISGNWQPINPVGIDAVVGDITPITLSSPSTRRQQEAHASFDGQTLNICPHTHSTTSPQHNCVSVVGTQRDFARGFRREIASERLVRGPIRCDLPPHRH